MLLNSSIIQFLTINSGLEIRCNSNSMTTKFDYWEMMSQLGVYQIWIKIGKFFKIYWHYQGPNILKTLQKSVVPNLQTF